MDEIADRVSSIIIEAAKQSIPFKEITVRPNEPPWINSNIKRQIRQRKRLFKRAKKSNNEHIWTQFRTKRNSVTAFNTHSKTRIHRKNCKRSQKQRHQFQIMAQDIIKSFTFFFKTNINLIHQHQESP